ncbi:MAG: hypothetical protein AB7P03_22405 [Kofleriaceae bacterium]
MRPVAHVLMFGWVVAAGHAQASPWRGTDDADELIDSEHEPQSDRSATGERALESGIVATRGAPAIAEVLAAAHAAAGLDRSPSRGWSRRARLAALMPWISVRWGWDASWQDTEPDVDRGTVLDVRATWRLDRLVFDGRELQAASMEAARRRERTALSSRVIRAYFAWIRAGGPSEQQPRLQALEAQAILDDATAGWFSEEVQRLRHFGSEPRSR